MLELIDEDYNFCGTVGEETMLKDSEGNRLFVGILSHVN